MNKTELSDEQKKLVREKANEANRQIVEAKRNASFYQKQFHDEANKLIDIINQDIERFKQKNESGEDQRNAILAKIQESVLAGDVSGTKELLEKINM
jgi:cell division septum initiation protein DivIVA